MPPQELAFLYDRARVWPCTGYDSYGQPVVDVPEDITCRWLDVVSDMLSPQGNTVRLDVTVIVDRVIPVGSRMQLMEFTGECGVDLATPCVVDPSLWVLVGAMFEVKQFNQTPDLKGRAAYTTVGLIRLTATGVTMLPPITVPPEQEALARDFR